MKSKLSRLASGLLLAGLTLAPNLSNACSSFILREPDGSYVYGRTVEFGIALPLKLALYPRNYEFKGTGPDGVPGSGLNWTAKYAVVGANAFSMELLADGMNEKGLTAGMLYLPVSSEYQKPVGDDAKNSIASYQVLNWILSNFATVDEVKAGLQKTFVNSATLGQWKGVVKMHYTVHDLSGKSIVVEYLNGKLEITDNPIGALTNEPPMKWQLLNVENYLNLSPFDKQPVTIEGVKFEPRSAGSGLHGLPGDFMSQSRFMRAFTFSKAAQKYATEVPKVELAWHLVNTFDIPPGSSIASKQKNADGQYIWDFTQLSTVADAKNLTYYIRPFGGMDTNKLNLNEHDLNSNERKMWDIVPATTYKTVR